MKNKTALLKVRCTPTELKAWKKAARTAKQGKPLVFAKYVRQKLTQVPALIQATAKLRQHVYETRVTAETDEKLAMIDGGICDELLTETFNALNP